MLREPTREKLIELRLDAFEKAWAQQQADPEIERLAFDDRLALLVDAECLDRHNQRLARNLREAKLRIGQACLEDLDYAPVRKLDRKRIHELATCRWIAEHHNIAITGATGVGKTYVACALAQQACRQGYRALYRRASRLFDELTLARADGSYSRLLNRLARIDLLVIDDWGLAAVADTERRDLLDVMEDRDGTRSTIMTSQLPIEKWHDHVGDPTVADAICDRLLHRAHRIVLQGPSRRKEPTSN
jgi:DNA replication protein DnaC